MRKSILLTGILAVLTAVVLTACSAASAASPDLTPAVAQPPAPTVTIEPPGAPSPAPVSTRTSPPQPSSAPTQVASPASTSAATRDPADWQNWPVIPATLSQRARQIYADGLVNGSRAEAFSKVGDCGGTPTWFLGDFDRGPRYFDLGPYTDLEAVIAAYPGSFERSSLAVRNGFTASGVLLPLWADPKQCQSGESPLACEYRLHRPSIALIMLGTNNAPHVERFEADLRRVLDETIAHGVLPVLATKADNLEGDQRINAIIARLAVEYELPLWNFWRAVQDLPDGGLQDDGGHLTWAPNDFSDPRNLESAWAVRNLNALQVLDFLRRELR